MDIYTTFLIQFLNGLQNGLRGIETIVFSTRLTRITPLLRRRNIDAALQLIAKTVQDWSGGTKIGACLHEFTRTMAADMVTSKTLVIIISDGWDTGIPRCSSVPWPSFAAWLCVLSGSIHCSGARTISLCARVYRQLCLMCMISCQCITWRACDSSVTSWQA